MSDSAVSRRERKKDKTHRAIMHSAKVLFEQHGIGGVTIDQISEGADVSRSTFFSHFASLDDLLEQIAAQEIADLFNAVEAGGDEPSVRSLLRQLNSDTYPYPYLACELLMRSILTKGESPFARVDKFVRSEIEEKGGYDELKKIFSSKDLSAFILGSFFGLVFQRLVNNEPFGNPTELSDKIMKFITFLDKQEEEL